MTSLDCLKFGCRLLQSCCPIAPKDMPLTLVCIRIMEVCGCESTQSSGAGVQWNLIWFYA